MLAAVLCGGVAALIADQCAYRIDQMVRHETDLAIGRVGKLPARAGQVCELSLAGLPSSPSPLKMLPLAIVAVAGAEGGNTPRFEIAVMRGAKMLASDSGEAAPADWIRGYPHGLVWLDVDPNVERAEREEWVARFQWLEAPPAGARYELWWCVPVHLVP